MRVIFLLLIGAGLAALGFGKMKQRTQGDLVRQPIAYHPRHTMNTQKAWRKPGTIAAHATGPAQTPIQSGPADQTFTSEVNKLNERIKTTSHPEWRMRYGRAMFRMAAQLDRSNSGKLHAKNVGYGPRDGFNGDVGGSQYWNNSPASDFTRVSATYQARFTHPGMLQGQPQAQHTQGLGTPNRRVDRSQNPNRVRTLRGAWRQVNYR